MNDSEEANQVKRVQITVIGRVQGVGFRYFTQDAARNCGLVGWVRNNYDGSVEICAEGPDTSINAFLKRLKQGSSSSLVRKVNVQWQSPQGKFSSFFIRT